ncbi:keratin, type I cytoskeletal 13-like [Heterodontus francisci]|uniref:keratin, type I cytoskeletal 13-like n=1 Tax=Heterodontus francisci TaxID=7792 RepID=UPI00355B0E21
MSCRQFSSSSLQYSSGNSSRRSYGGGGYGVSSGSYSSLGSGLRGYSMGGSLGGRLGQHSYGGLSGGSSSLSVSGVSVSGGLVGNEKETMINLNNRLCTYLQKVKDLEKANTKLELQLKEFQVGKVITGIDYAAYDAVIRPLREQILAIHLGNARLALDLDNAALAAKDFQNKFENEFNIKQSVEADIFDIKALNSDYICNIKDLETDIVSAKDELTFLKKNHEEELVQLRQQVAGTVTVQVDSGPTVDFTKALTEIREEYDAICTKNKADLDAWYQTQIETQTVQTVQVNQEAEGSKLQITELRRQVQNLQAECESLHSGNCSLEASIQGINDLYSQKLQSLQDSISQLELELTTVRNDIVQRAKNYEALLNIKMQLEKEIIKYRELIEGSASSSSQTTTGIIGSSGETTTTTIKTETRTVRAF